MGCQCEPTIKPVERTRAQAAGADSGYQILHRRGCPLGELAYKLNRVGILPQYWVKVPDPRCRR